MTEPTRSSRRRGSLGHRLRALKLGIADFKPPPGRMADVWKRWMDECRQLKGQDIDRATWRSVVLGFSALALMSAGVGLVWLYKAHGLPLAAAVALVDVMLVTREWHEIRTLKNRAITYLRLPEEAGGDVTPVTGLPRRRSAAS